MMRRILGRSIVSIITRNIIVVLVVVVVAATSGAHSGSSGGCTAAGQGHGKGWCGWHGDYDDYDDDDSTNNTISKCVFCVKQRNHPSSSSHRRIVSSMEIEIDFAVCAVGLRCDDASARSSAAAK